MPGARMTVLDLSNNDLSTIDGPCFKVNGVTGILSAVFDKDNPPQTMFSAALACRAAGIDILGWYAFIYFGSPYGVTRDTKWAIANALATNVKRVYLDCE